HRRGALVDRHTDGGFVAGGRSGCSSQRRRGVIGRRRDRVQRDRGPGRLQIGSASGRVGGVAGRVFLCGLRGVGAVREVGGGVTPRGPATRVHACALPFAPRGAALVDRHTDGGFVAGGRSGCSSQRRRGVIGRRRDRVQRDRGPGRL